MLKIKIPEQEYWDETKEEFVYFKEVDLCMEHSLVSLAKWESKWHKPFLKQNNRMDDKTTEEIIDYFRCMTLTQNVDPSVYMRLTENNIKEISEYIENPMTATTFGDEKGKAGREIVTAELIYYWMVALQIPMECQKWHLNRLLTLVRVCNIKNQPPKKMSTKQLAKRNSALNAKRRAALHSKG